MAACVSSFRYNSVWRISVTFLIVSGNHCYHQTTPPRPIAIKCAMLCPFTDGSITRLSINSFKQLAKIWYTALPCGLPTCTLISALSKNAISTALVMFDVAIMRKFSLLLNESIWVSTAFTTLIASDGSELDKDFVLHAVKLSTSSVLSQNTHQQTNEWILVIKTLANLLK